MRIVLLALLGAGVITAGGHATLADPSVDTTVSDLIAQGWHGDPNDNKEALYPPVLKGQ